MITVSELHLERFFAPARERYNILLRRQRGEPKPWTQDPVFQSWRFCNVFREDDRTTVWFRENIREPLRDNPSVMLATIAFRAFNRIETGEVLKPYLLADNWDLAEWEHDLRAFRRDGNSVVTGAYMIKTAPNMDKISGVLYQLREAKMREPGLLAWAKDYTPEKRSMQGLWELLRTFPYMGDFTSNEVVVDLSHTYVLERAPDKMTWTNPGPGCTIGIGMLLYANAEAFNRTSRKDREVMLEIMKYFLKASQEEKHWPQQWPAWTLHTVQFWFCELQKFMKGQQGLKLKRRYKELADVHHSSA